MMDSINKTSGGIYEQILQLEKERKYYYDTPMTLEGLCETVRRTADEISKRPPGMPRHIADYIEAYADYTVRQAELLREYGYLKEETNNSENKSEQSDITNFWK
jgi:hypothetical protein